MEIDRRTALAATLAAGALANSTTEARSQAGPSLNPVSFWNDAAIELVALDHSIDADDARAPGPCASAWAMGLAHVVMADAVHYAYKTNYKPFLAVTPPQPITNQALFVGGAVASILNHIFSAPAHGFLIGNKRAEFIKASGATNLADWQAGVSFGSRPEFRSRWVWEDIHQKILPPFSTYVPKPRRHNIDPFNAGQGFYGQRWREQKPFVLANADEVAVKDPPREGTSEYDSDLALVRVKGALSSTGTSTIPARTQQETNIGLFWAYDGPRLIGTPPRLYNQIVRAVAASDNLNVAELARLLALVNLALADAGIVSWAAKYKHAIWRPVLGIQNIASGGDPEWKPLGAPRTNAPRFAVGLDIQVREVAQTLLGAEPSIASQRGASPRLQSALPNDQDLGKAAFTPNFPAFPSGHATFGSACFNTLKAFRAQRSATSGNPDAINIEFVSDELNGVSIDHFNGTPRPRVPFTYTSIDKMIDDNNLSRVYLGVHWKFDATYGAEAGAEVAKKIVQKAYTT
jgi:membrane-associated phospholipid phosphatase